MTTTQSTQQFDNVQLQVSELGIPCLRHYEGWDGQACTCQLQWRISEHEAEMLLGKYHDMMIELESDGIIEFKQCGKGWTLRSKDLVASKGIWEVYVVCGSPLYACLYMPWPDSDICNRNMRGYQVEVRYDGDVTYRIYEDGMPAIE